MTPRDYQQDIVKRAVKILNYHGLVYLSMEVRTGKTLTSLAIAKEYKAKKVLFVTKKKAIPSIESDFKNFGFDFELEVINFESIHKAIMIPDMVIVDEAHSIGAYPKSSKRTEKLKKIVGEKPLILLSGTPTPEGYSQIYHQLWISENSPFKNDKTFYKWAKSYVNVSKRTINGYRVNDYSDAKSDKVLEVIEPIMIAYSQKDAGFKALVEEETHKLPISSKLLEWYNILKRDRVIEINDDEVISAATPAVLLQKLHQLSSGTILTDDGARYIIDPFKAEYIKKTFGGQHIAIFYKFVAEKEMLQATFDNIVDTPEAFNENLSSIFIGQYQSAREGINLSTADALIMMSIDFSAVSYFQARARLQTKERTTPAKLHWIFSDGLLDQYVYEAVSDKQDFTLRYYNESRRG